MKLPTTLALTAATAGAGIYIYLVEQHTTSTTQVAATAHLIASAAPGDINEIKIEDTNGITRIKRGGDPPGIWNITRPFKDRANQGFADDLVDLLTNLQLKETIVERHDIQGSAPFGISSKTVTLKKDKDTNLIELVIGKPAPFKNSVYARNLLADDPERIFVVQSEKIGLLDRLAAEVRHPNLFPFGADKIVRIRIGNGDGDSEIELSRTDTQESAQWWLTKPLNTRADNTTVSTIVHALTSARATADPDNTNIGTGTQATRATAWSEDGGDPSTVKLLTSGTGNTIKVLAKITGRRPVFSVPGDVLEAITITPNDVRDDKLASVDTSAVNTLFIKSQANPDVLMFKNGQRWWLVNNNRQEEANAGQIDAMVKTLNSHQILEFTSDAVSDFTPYGLDKPFLTLTFSRAEMTSEDGIARFPITPENSITLRLGQAGSRLYANFGGQPFVYTIDPVLLSSIPTETVRWRSLRLVAFSIFDLRKITITEGSKPPSTLTYGYTDSSWTFTRPGIDLTPALITPRAEVLSALLSTFHAESWLSRPGDALQLLRTPSLRIDIEIERQNYDTGTPEPQTLTLLFSPTVAGRDETLFYYGTLAGNPEVFLISRETYQFLTSSLVRE